MAVAVGHKIVCAVSEPEQRSDLSPLRRRKVSCFSLLSCALGVSQDEESFAFVRRTDFFRRKQPCLNAITHASKVIVYLFEPQS
jgi:hypothetical protein